MDEWRKDWRRIGGGMIAAAFGLWVARLSAAQQVVVFHSGNLRTIPAPDEWLVWVFLALGIFGAYSWLSTYPLLDMVPMFGKKAARKPDCDLSHDIEAVNREFFRGDTQFKECSFLFVTVKNTGDTAQFAAQFSGISGLQRADGGSVERHFGDAAWEATTANSRTIGSGARSRLLLMMLFTDPVAAWFQLPNIPMWDQSDDNKSRHLTDWLLIPKSSSTDFGFDLEVINESKKVSATWHIDVHRNGSENSYEASIRRR